MLARLRMYAWCTAKAKHYFFVLNWIHIWLVIHQAMRHTICNLLVKTLWAALPLCGHIWTQIRVRFFLPSLFAFSLWCGNQNEISATKSKFRARHGVECMLKGKLLLERAQCLAEINQISTFVSIFIRSNTLEFYQFRCCAESVCQKHCRIFVATSLLNGVMSTASATHLKKKNMWTMRTW